jgi:hypothetical protein
MTPPPGSRFFPRFAAVLACLTGCDTVPLPVATRESRTRRPPK